MVQPSFSSTSTHDLNRALDLLRSGGALGVPTDTVWGLVADPDQASAVDRLYVLKGRDEGKPVQVLCPDIAEARRWAALTPALSQDFEGLTRFWPGALTLVVPASQRCPAWLQPAGQVGLRVPAGEQLTALFGAFGGSLAGTSLNRSGQPAARTRTEAAALDLAPLLWAGEAGGALASTVYELATGRVLRPGGVSESELRGALGRV
jgi:L-threonylcarbamoyladenylate synthase